MSKLQGRRISEQVVNPKRETNKKKIAQIHMQKPVKKKKK